MTDSYRSSIEALVNRDVVAMERIKQPTASMLRSVSLAPALLRAPTLPEA